MYNISSQYKFIPFLPLSVGVQISAVVVIIEGRHLDNLSSLLQSTIICMPNVIVKYFLEKNFINHYIYLL